jgi:hypothetical protein
VPRCVLERLRLRHVDLFHDANARGRWSAPSRATRSPPRPQKAILEMSETISAPASPSHS